MKSNDHLLISYPISFDGQLSVDIEALGFAITNRVQVNKYKNELTGSTHDFMYAVVSYVVFKPFIGSFLKELGSKKAKSLTPLLSHIFKKIRKKRLATVTYEDMKKLQKLQNKYQKKKKKNKQFKKKVGEIGRLSPPVAFRVKRDTHTVDFVFPADIPVKDIKIATTRMHKILTDKKNNKGGGSILYVLRGGRWVAEKTRNLML